MKKYLKMSRYSFLINLLVCGWVLWDIFFHAPPKINPNVSYENLEGLLFKGHLEGLVEGKLPNIERKEEPKASSTEIKPVQRGSSFKKGKTHSHLQEKLKVEISTSNLNRMRQVSFKSSEQDPFRFYDGIISENPTTFSLESKVRKGDVTLRLLQLSKWQDFYLLKFSLENGEVLDFFVSAVKIRADKEFIASDYYLPVSCQKGRTIFGIVLFPIHKVTGRRIFLVLKENGHQYRNFEVSVNEYKFT